MIKQITLKKTKTNNLKVLLLSFTIILIISLIVLSIFYFQPSLKLKRYLKHLDYTCNKTICHKNINNQIIQINYQQGKMIIDNNNYVITINQLYPTIELKNSSLQCYYKKENYQPLSLIDETFTDNRQCITYIDDVNKSIQEFQDILDKAKVSLQSLNKEKK